MISQLNKFFASRQDFPLFERISLPKLLQTSQPASVWDLVEGYNTHPDCPKFRADVLSVLEQLKSKFFSTTLTMDSLAAIVPLGALDHSDFVQDFISKLVTQLKKDPLFSPVLMGALSACVGLPKPAFYQKYPQILSESVLYLSEHWKKRIQSGSPISNDEAFGCLSAAVLLLSRAKSASLACATEAQKCVEVIFKGLSKNPAFHLWISSFNTFLKEGGTIQDQKVMKLLGFRPVDSTRVLSEFQRLSTTAADAIHDLDRLWVIQGAYHWLQDRAKQSSVSDHDIQPFIEILTTLFVAKHQWGDGLPTRQAALDSLIRLTTVMGDDSDEGAVAGARVVADAAKNALKSLESRYVKKSQSQRKDLLMRQEDSGVPLRTWRPGVSQFFEGFSVWQSPLLSRESITERTAFITSLMGKKKPIDSCYVNVVVVRAETTTRAEESLEHSVNYEAVYGTKEAIALEQLFDQPKDKKTESEKATRLLLLGKPGVGKSTLVEKLLHSWAKGSLFSDRFTWVFELKARNLTRDAFSSDTSLAELILAENVSSSASIEEKETALAMIRNILDSPDLRRQTLIILDGYDEFSEASGPYKALIDRQILDRPTEFPHVLVTSRPFFDLPKLDLVLESIGFQDEQITAYIRGEFKGRDAQADAVVAQLQGIPQLWSLAHIPVQLEMIIALFDSKLNRFSTLTQVYQGVETLLTERLMRKLPPQVKMVGDSADTHASFLQKILRDLAFSLQTSGRIIATKAELEDLVRQHLDAETGKTGSESGTDDDSQDTLIATIRDQLIQSGFLKLIPDPRRERYYFTHLSIQEYFAGKTIAEVSNGGRSSFYVHRDAFQEELLAHRYSPRFQLVLQFALGQASEAGVESLCQKLLDTDPALHPMHRLMMEAMVWTEAEGKLSIERKTVLKASIEAGVTEMLRLLKSKSSDSEFLAKLLTFPVVGTFLIYLCRQNDADLSKQAFTALGCIQNPTGEVIQFWVEKLKDFSLRDESKRLTNRSTPFRYRTPTFNAETVAVDHAVVRLAIECLTRLPNPSEEVIQALVLALTKVRFETYDRDLFSAALGVLCRLQNPSLDVIKILLRASNQHSTEVLDAVANINSKCLLALAKDPDLVVRQSAIKALSRLENPPDEVITFFFTVVNYFNTLSSSSYFNGRKITPFPESNSYRDFDCRGPIIQYVLSGLAHVPKPMPELIQVLLSLAATEHLDRDDRQTIILALGRLQNSNVAVTKFLLSIAKEFCTMDLSDPRWPIAACGVQALGYLQQPNDKVVKFLLTAAGKSIQRGDIGEIFRLYSLNIIQTLMRSIVPLVRILDQRYTNIIQLLLTAAKDSDEDVRYAAIRGLSCVKYPTADIIQVLLESLKDSNLNSRQYAIYALSQIDYPTDQVCEAIIDAVKDSSIGPRDAAIYALERFTEKFSYAGKFSTRFTPDKEVYSILLDIVKYSDVYLDPKLYSAIITIFTHFLDPTADVIQFLRDRAQLAENALEQELYRDEPFKQKENARKYLEEAIQALGNLRHLTSELNQVLIACLKDQNPQIKLAALRTLYRLHGPDDGMQFLFEAIRDPDQTVINGVAGILLHYFCEYPNDHQSWIAAAKYPHPEIRAVAGRHARNFKDVSVDVIRILLMWYSGNYGSDLRFDAILAFSNINNPNENVIRVLLAEAKSGGYEFNHAIWALSRLSNPPAEVTQFWVECCSRQFIRGVPSPDKRVFYVLANLQDPPSEVVRFLQLVAAQNLPPIFQEQWHRDQRDMQWAAITALARLPNPDEAVVHALSQGMSNADRYESAIEVLLLLKDLTSQNIQSLLDVVRFYYSPKVEQAFIKGLSRLAPNAELIQGLVSLEKERPVGKLLQYAWNHSFPIPNSHTDTLPPTSIHHHQVLIFQDETTYRFPIPEGFSEALIHDWYKLAFSQTLSLAKDPSQ
jgi:HEAT repeat protein